MKISFLLVVAVHRRTLFSLFNVMLPVVAVATLAFLIFFVDVRNIYIRLELVFSLFLALAAIQFVVAGYQTSRNDTNSHGQTAINNTVFCLMALAFESILAYHIAVFPNSKAMWEVRWTRGNLKC